MMNHTNINIESPKGQMTYYVEYVDSNADSSDDMNYKINSQSNKIEFYGRSWRNVTRNNNEWAEVTDLDMLKALASTYYDSFRTGISTLAAKFNLDFYSMFASGSNYNSFRTGMSMLPTQFLTAGVPTTSYYEYQHIAWSNAPDGSLDFDKANYNNKNYIGTVVNNNLNDPIQSEYDWFYIGGDLGANIINGNYKKRTFDFTSSDAERLIDPNDSKYSQKIVFKFDLNDFNNISKGSILDASDRLVYSKYSLNIATQLKMQFKSCKLAKTAGSNLSYPIKVRLYTTGKYKDGENTVEEEITILEKVFNITNNDLQVNNSKILQAYNILNYEKENYLPGEYLYIEIKGLINNVGKLLVSEFKIEEGNKVTPFTYSSDDLSLPECGNLYNPCYHVAFMNKLYNIDNSFTTEEKNGYDKYTFIGLLQDYAEEPSQSYADYDWYYVQNELYNGENGYIVNKPTYNTSKLNIYFPSFSVDVYKKNIKYALNASVRIGGNEVEICSKLLDRNDAVATNNIKRFSNTEYYEYISVEIIDPWRIIYGSEWETFRKEVCNKNKDELNNTGLNNIGSLLNISLHPVCCTDTEDGRKIYTEVDNYSGGQNAINLSDSTKDYLSFYIYSNHTAIGEEIKLYPQIYYNRSYDTTLDGFNKYIKQTYQLSDFNVKVECVLQDSDNIYGYTVLNIDDIMNTSWVPQDIVDVNGDHILSFNSWDDYKEGLYIHMFLHICVEDDLDSSVLCISSNRLLLTQKLFKYLIKIPDLEDNRINIDDIPMNIYNINAVNKIQQNVIQVERPDDYKANIIKPVFFRSQNLSSIVIHPAVTEQICINLDIYKSKVDSFILQVEDVSFVESGRNNSGVIFSIKGSSLPNTVTAGTYYILNQDSEVVTSGKYSYES